MELLKNSWLFLGENFEAIIAVCALALTVNRIVVMRKHNKISVKPFLTGHTDETSDQHNFTFSLELVNNGLGPAFIKSFEVKHKENALAYMNNDELKDKIQALLPHGKIITARVLGNGYALAEKERALLLKITVSKRDSAKVKAIKKVVDNLNLHIRYECMYGESCHYSTDSLIKKS